MLEASNNLDNIQVVSVYNVNQSEHIMKIFLHCLCNLFQLEILIATPMQIS